MVFASAANFVLELGARGVVVTARHLEDLERHRPVERQMAGPVDDGESPLRDLPLDLKTALEQRPRQSEDVRALQRLAGNHGL